MQNYGDTEHWPTVELYLCGTMHVVFKTVTGRERWIKSTYRHATYTPVIRPVHSSPLALLHHPDPIKHKRRKVISLVRSNTQSRTNSTFCVSESRLVLAGSIHNLRDSMLESCRSRLFTPCDQLPWRRIERPAVVTMNDTLKLCGLGWGH
jgi:hypothetical protein